MIDIEAVEVAIFGRAVFERNGTESRVEFRYQDYVVTVKSDGWVTVSSADEAMHDRD